MNHISTDIYNLDHLLNTIFQRVKVIIVYEKCVTPMFKFG